MKKCIIIACILMLVGAGAFVVALSMNDWDFKKLSIVKTETNTYEINDEFSSISIKTNTADIVFLPSDDGKCRIVCHEEKKQKHSVSAQNGTLTIDVVNEKKWYDYIGINFDTPKITLYLPEEEYAVLFIEESTGDVDIPNDFKFDSVNISVSTGDVKYCAAATGSVKIEASTGDICVENVSAGSLSLSVSTGDVTALGVSCEGNVTVDVSTGDARLTNVTCTNLISSGDTGDITLKNVIAVGKLSVETDTGDVKLDRCDAAELEIETDTGDVRGTLLSEKTFVTNSDTGDVDVPKDTIGGRCEVTTDTGDIRLEIANN